MTSNLDATLFLCPGNGRLRDVIDTAQLRDYCRKTGEVQRVWLPWQHDDQRYFGFVSFKEPSAALDFVSRSPHKLGGTDIHASFQRKNESKNATNLGTLDATSGVVAPLDVVPTRYDSWDYYYAPQRIKDTLTGIGEELNPEHTNRLQKSRKALFGDESISAPGVPLVLFHGPPGSGKTHAMKIIAATSGLKPFVLSTKKLQEDTYSAPHLWATALAEISKMESAAILIDEAEVLLGRRSVMSNYASVAVKAHQQMLETFLKWADGLATKTHSPGRSLFICMSTNLRDNLDEAVMSRVRVSVGFALPDAAQCTQWWSAHARQLNRFELLVLGRMSSIAHLSFREMWALAECMVQRDARRQSVSGSAGQVGFAEYASELLRGAWNRLPAPLAALSQAQTAIWTASSVLFLLDRTSRLMPRARL